MKTTDTVTYDASAAIVLTTEAQKQLTNAKDYVIDSHTMFELASEDLMQVKALQKDVEAKRTAITGPINQAVKAINDLFRAPKEYLDQAEATLKRAMPGPALSTTLKRLATLDFSSLSISTRVW